MKILEQITYEPKEVSCGYTDRILKIDLSENKIEIVNVSSDFRNNFIGGRGYALKLIWDGTNEETRYDSPENILVMAGGPLCNEPAFPGTGKFIIGTISPLTGTFVDSNIGGHFGSLMKLAGFDAIAVTGISNEDVVVCINSDEKNINISTAPKYGKEIDLGSITYGDAILKNYNNGEYNDKVAAVTVGEGTKNSYFGILNSIYYDISRKRVRAKQAGRGGTGTVMAFKGLKAVVVQSSLSKANGNKAKDVKGVRKAGSQLKKTIRENDEKQLNLAAWGTTGLSEYMNKFHIFPVQNYQYGQHSEAPKLFAKVFLDNYFSKKKPDGCYYGCNLACAKGAEDVLITRGNKKGQKISIDGPEYETVGAVCCMGIFDPHFVMEYNYYCDEYALDTISTGVSISFFMECVQRGYLNKDDIGYDLKFGNIETAFRAMEEIGEGKGFGKIIGKGVANGKKWVAENYASKNNASVDEVTRELNKFGMETKGLEFSMYITKESLAQQGGYGFALKGPQHDEAWLIFIDQVHGELPTFEQKANALHWFPLIRTWFNATGLCKLPWIDVRHPEAANTDYPAKNLPTLEYFVQYLNSTTGSNKSLQDILDDSERLYIQQKLINLRQGKGTRVNDMIPHRAIGPAFFNEYEFRMEYYDNWLKEHEDVTDIPDDPEERHKLLMKMRLNDFEKLCDAVYKQKGFNENGIPLTETVEKFGLMDEQAEKLLEKFRIAN